MHSGPTIASRPVETVVEALWGAPDRDLPFSILGRGLTAETRSHGELLDEAEAVAAGLGQRGVGPGARVGVVARTSFDFVISSLAVWRAGAALVPLPPPARGVSRAAWTPIVNSRLSKARAALVIEGTGDPAFECSVPLAKSADLLPGSSSVAGVDPAPGDIAIIQFSSGSTATPKGVVTTHGALAAQIDRRRQLPVVEGRHDLHTAPLHFAAGVGRCVAYPMALGWSLTLMPTRLFIEDPASWLVAISRGRVTHSGGANFAYALATREIGKGLPEEVDLSCWLEASCGGGEAPDHATIARFSESARPLGFRTESLTAGYGLSETGIVSSVLPGSSLRFLTFDRAALAQGEVLVAPEGREGTTTLACAGPLVPGAELRVIASDGTDLPERRVGELIVRTPFMMRGYLDDPEATEAAFVHGWFKTGDLGFVADREVFVSGRVKDVILVRGQNFHAEDIERVARAAMETDEGLIAAFGVRKGSTDDLVLAVETRARGERQVEHLRKTIAREVWSATGLVTKDILFVEPETLPTTATGKLRRTLIKDRYEAGELPDGLGPVDA